MHCFLLLDSLEEEDASHFTIAEPVEEDTAQAGGAEPEEAGFES